MSGSSPKAQIIDLPNVIVSAVVPLEIFGS
jgi:hypothetical protein